MCRQSEYQYGQVMRTLLGVLALAVWLLGVAAPAPAETMTCRYANTVRQLESVPVGDVEGHWVGVAVRVGMAFCDAADIANFTVLASWNQTAGKGGEARAYALWNFVEGSTMLIKFQDSVAPPVDQNFAWDDQGTGEILSGTGRFAGITGSLAYTGKVLKPIKGELGTRAAGDCTFTYTLPAK